MSKFTIKVEIQGLKIEVEGSKEDVPRLAQRVGEQIGSLVQPALLLEPQNHRPADFAGDDAAGSGKGRSRGRRAGTGGGRGRTTAAEPTLSVDPSKHGAPRQGWNTLQKSIWLLYVAGRALSSYSIEKVFNAQFKASGAIRRQNISRDLDKEKLRGKEALVGAEMNDGTATYYLTDAGKTAAERLISGGEIASAATAGS